MILTNVLFVVSKVTGVTEVGSFCICQVCQFDHHAK